MNIERSITCNVDDNKKNRKNPSSAFAEIGFIERATDDLRT